MNGRSERRKPKRSKIALPRLSEVRCQKGWSLQKLADEVTTYRRKSKPMAQRLDVRTVREIENGNEAMEYIADDIAGAMGCTVDQLRGLDVAGSINPSAKYSRHQVRGWDIINRGKSITSPNGLTWHVCELRHSLVEDTTTTKPRKARGKLYNLSSHLSTADQRDLVKYLKRHPDVCCTLAKHPNFASLIDTFPDDHDEGAWWVIDEWIDGPSLAAQLDRWPLPPRLLKAMMLGIFEALMAMHQARMIHRNLSPRFITVTDDRAVLTDLEVTKLLGGRPTVNDLDEWIDHRYHDPEVHNPSDADEASDFYSWAMIFAHAVKGKQPPKGRLEAQQLLGASTLPAPVTRIALQCLEPKSKRPTNAKKILKALSKWP